MTIDLCDLTETEITGLKANTTCSNEKAPEDEDYLTIFGALVALDFECYKFPEDHPSISTLTEIRLKDFILANKGLAKECRPPSYLGLFIGKFDFLTEEENV